MSHQVQHTGGSLKLLTPSPSAEDTGRWALSRACSSSRVSLKGADSKLTPPGLLDSMKPKSMCTRWPSSSTRMLPLWRSLICAGQGLKVAHFGEICWC